MSGQGAGFLVGMGEGTELSLGGLAVEVEVRGEHAAGLLTLMGVTVDPHRLVPPHIYASEDECTYVVAGTIPGRQDVPRPKGLQCPPATTQRAILARPDVDTAEHSPGWVSRSGVGSVPAQG